MLGASGALRAAESTTGLIDGSVAGPAGAPLAGARVSAASPSAQASATTDARGRFVLLGLVPDTYVLTVAATGFVPAVERGVVVQAGRELQRTVHLAARDTRTIGRVAARGGPFDPGATGDAYVVSGDTARAAAPPATSAGLASYLQRTVQGAIAAVPGVELDPFANAIARGGRVGDTVFDYDAVPIPQGLIVEPGGNVAGAQLPTTGVASTRVVLAGFSNESDNALGGVVNEIPAVGSAPGLLDAAFGAGLGTAGRAGDVRLLAATPDLHWRYAFAAAFGSETFPYGDGRTFYPAEAGTYGLAIARRGTFSVESNVHDRISAADDLSLLVLLAEAHDDQYGSPYAGETVGAFDGTTTTFPGANDPAAPVTYAAGVRGTIGLATVQWQHTSAHALTRLLLYGSFDGASAGGPFWDDDGFPDGSISLAQTSMQRLTGASVDDDTVLGNHHLVLGGSARITTSSLDQIVPTADETVTSQPTISSTLLYAGDTWKATSRLTLAATARVTQTHIRPSAGAASTIAAIDPHEAVVYRIGANVAVRADEDAITVPPAGIEADRVDAADPAPFVRLGPEIAHDATFALEGGERTRVRLTYFIKHEHDLIDVLPYDFRSAIAASEAPGGVGVPSNAGDLVAHGVELDVERGPLQLRAGTIRAFSSSASQFAYNDLNAPAIAAGHLTPVGYVPDFSATLSYALRVSPRLRITPALSYATGYPYGNGTMVYVFDANGQPVRVPNDNHVNPGSNYYFLKNPALPFDAATNPLIGSLGTNEGADPNTLRSPPALFANLHVERDLSPRVTLELDVANVFDRIAPTAYQSNPYLIGPPGYTGGSKTYAACYGQILAGSVPCAPGSPAGTVPYVLGNGVPTNDGRTQALPWTYGTGAYVPQSYPLGRTIQLRLRYRV